MHAVQRVGKGKREVTEGAVDAGRKPLRRMLTFDNLDEHCFAAGHP
jgi:hypothetical protein